MHKNNSTPHSSKPSQAARCAQRQQPWAGSKKTGCSTAPLQAPGVPASSTRSVVPVLRNTKSFGSSSTLGHQVDVQIMVLNGSFKTITLSQTTVFEFLLLNGGSIEEKEILCDSVTTAKAWQAQFKKNGHRVQTGERRFGF